MERHRTHDSINNLAVIGSCGASGSKTFAISLALHLQQQAQTQLVDLIPASGLDMALGIEQMKGIRWSDFEGARGQIDIPRLLPLMPQYAGLPILTNNHHKAAHIDDLAIQSYLQSGTAAQTLSVVQADARGLSVFHNQLDLVVVLTPLTAVGVVRTMAIKKLAYHTPVVVVASHTGSVEVSPELFRKTTGLEPAAFLPFTKAIQRSAQLGQGPFSGPQQSYKKYFAVTSKVASHLFSESSTEHAHKATASQI